MAHLNDYRTTCGLETIKIVKEESATDAETLMGIMDNWKLREAYVSIRMFACLTTGNFEKPPSAKAQRELIEKWYVRRLSWFVHPSLYILTSLPVMISAGQGI